MRILGIVFLSLTPFLFGLDYRSSLKKRKRFFTLFKEFIVFVREQIRFCGREIDEIFALLLSDPRFNLPIFKDMERCFKNGENTTKMLESRNDIRLKTKEINEINSFISQLGKSDTEGEINHCDYYFSVFEQIEGKLSEAYSVKVRLAVSLSLSLAAVMFIIMI